LQAKHVHGTDGNAQGQVESATTPYFPAGNAGSDNAQNKASKRLSRTPVFFDVINVQIVIAVQLLDVYEVI
jgi:hypothetical protein